MEIPSSPASASLPHSSRSRLSSPASISLRRSWVTSPWRICSARPWRSCCSSLNPKSMWCSCSPPRRLPRRERHAEAKDRDQIALDLVRAAPEGEDDQPAVRMLETGLEDRAGRVVLEVRALADDLHQQPERLEIELGAVHLRC